MVAFLLLWLGGVGSAHASNARFTVITPNLVRLEYDPSGRFTDEPSIFAIDRAARGPGELKTQGYNEKTTSLKTGVMSILYIDDGKPFHPGNLSVEINGVVRWVPGMTNTRNLGGTLHSLDMVGAPKELGQGLLSRDGWFLLDDSNGLLLKGASPGWVAARDRSGVIDWYLFGYGKDYRAALQSLTTVGGAVPLPRKYAFGAWYSRWWKYTSDDYREVVREFHEHDFPLDVLVWDMYWHKPGWTGLSFDRNLLPDAEKLLAELHAEKLAVPFNDHPADGVQPYEDMYSEFMRGMGQEARGKVIPYDAGDRKYMETLFRVAHSAREKDGADFWWLDWMGDDKKPMNRLDWLNELYWRQSEAQGKRGMSFARWAGWGDHRHPVHFSGDVRIGWPMLAFEVPFTSTAGNVGAFFWSHDVGGFFDDIGGIKARRDTELYARWTQFGALSPVLRIHSVESPFLDRRPWKWGKMVERVSRSMFHLRSELLPYLYSSAWQSHSESVPLVRPMYIDHAGDEEAYWQSQEYGLGDALIAAPVTSKGTGPGKVASQIAWLPEGSPWYQWFTGERYKGGFHGLVSSDIDELPLFAKGGTPILLQPYTQRPATEALATLRIRAYPGTPGKTEKTVLYEDDGITQAYLSGSRAMTEIAYTQADGRAIFDVYATEGSYSGQLSARAYVLELPMTQAATRARANGSELPVKYDAATHTNFVVVPARDIREGFRVEVRAAELYPAERAAIRAEAQQRRARGIGLNGDAQLALQGAGLRALSKNVVEGFLGEGVTSGRLQVVDENSWGFRSKVVLDTSCAPGASCRFELQPPEAQDDAPTGSKLVRKARLTVLIGGKTHRFELKLDGAPTFLRQWSVNGPFPYNPDQDISTQRYAPEKTNEILSKTGWKSAPLQADRSVDLRAMLGEKQAIAYGLTCFRSNVEQGLKLAVGSDDGVEVFLDGRKLLSKNVFRALVSEPDEVTTLLPEGEHQLLFKVANRAGGWGFRSAIETGVPVEAHSCF